jgi:hypothetical protein
MVQLPPSGYRITTHDGPLASCDGNEHAIEPVAVSPRRFSGVSYIGAFCPNRVASPNRNPPNRHNVAEKLVDEAPIVIRHKKKKKKKVKYQPPPETSSSEEEEEYYDNQQPTYQTYASQFRFV